MSKGALSITEVLLGGDHIGIELGSEVVVGVLRWVVPFSFRSISSHDKFVGESTLRKLERVMAGQNLVINSEVWNWVVNVITSWLLLVLILGASSRGADWVGLSLNEVPLKLNGGSAGESHYGQCRFEH